MKMTMMKGSARQERNDVNSRSIME